MIGYAKTLKAAKTPQLEKFYRNNYISGKMGLILVGPLQDKKGLRKKAILRSLEKHYGSKVLRAKSAKCENRVGETELRDTSTWVVRPFDVKTPTLSFSFRVPDLAHEDIPAVDLLASVLGMGELSRLYQRLFYQTSLATDVSGGLYVPKDPGMLYFQAEMDSVDKLKSVAEEMFQEMRKICQEGPTTEELARVMANAESERLYATQTADGMASRLGFLKFIMGDLGFDQAYLDELRSVDIAKVKEVACRYLDYRRMSGVVLLPKQAPLFDTNEIANLSTRYLKSETPGVGVTYLTRSAGKGVELVKLSSGLQVCYNPRPMSQVFSMHASVLGGVRLEVGNPIERAETDWGASYMLSLTWNKGTTTKDSKMISAITEGRASSVDGFSGRNSVGLQLTGLARDWKVLSELFTEVLIDPVFPKEEVEHAKRIAEDSIRSIEDHSSQLCSKLFLETLFERHPYGRMIHGSLESLQAMRSEKLRAFHQAWLRPERLVVSVSGPVKSSALEAWMAQLEKQFRSRGKNKEDKEVNGSSQVLSDEPTLKAPRWVECNLGREQTHIMVGGLGTQIYAEDRHVLRLLQTLLGGQSGRLFIELREKKSLAYTVSPTSFEGLERGYLGTYIACAPQKREEAIRGIQVVLEKLAEKGPSSQEMNRAKEFYLGRRAMDLQSDTALAAHYGLEFLYQVPSLTEQNLLKKIRAITARDIQKVCKKYYIESYQVTSVVG